ncbi:hypothetical protein chiPu_0013699 [Chiloscyllium punctatum]|uniref:Uncharacterized protein n=1 Tax=Chiloscyllium punctatum TaxID=137246 RepID=A0A401SY26_CHIPU|nr:hypothetical protein [Chiloscyllium punctatum]
MNIGDISSGIIGRRHSRMKTFASIVLLGLLMLEIVLAAPTKNEEKARKLKQIQLLPNDFLEEHGYVNQDPRNFFEYEDGLIIDEPLISTPTTASFLPLCNSILQAPVSR